MRPLLPCLALLCACGSPKAPPPAFPPGFRFGASLAGFQVDPGCPTIPAAQCEDRGSDWYQWVTAKDQLSDLQALISFEPLEHGPGHWELYAQDFDLAATDLGLSSVRLSIEWSRVFPTSTVGLSGAALRAAADPGAIAHYHAVFQALKVRGLSPLVTINHYTLPLWLHDGVACHQDLARCTRRGWLDKATLLPEFEKYAAFLGEEFGAEVDDWATLNEPFAVVLPGYVFPTKDRVNPPGLQFHFDEAKQVMVAMIEGHAKAYDALKRADTVDADGDGQAANVGLVYALAPVRGKTPGSKADQKAADNLFYLYNTAFLDGVISGLVDADLDGQPDTTAPRPELTGRMDYLGVNYYSRVVVEGTAQPSFSRLSALTTFDPTTLVPFTDEPEGLHDALLWVKSRYGVPVIITETGASDPKDDGTGASWLVRYLGTTKQAIAEGADVRGFYVWSLMDNYEWNQGMAMRFGLYAVDPGPQKTRSARQSAKAYRDIIKARDIPPALAQQYPR